jgi:hypothetical protein
VKLDRQGALRLARNHWDKACPDGTVYLANQRVMVEELRQRKKAPPGSVLTFVPVPKVTARGTTYTEKAVFRLGGLDIDAIEPKDLEDCAHFMSQCLGAGGIREFDPAVGGLLSKLQARSDTRTLGTRLSRDQGQHLIDNDVLKAGDLVFYFKKSGEPGEPFVNSYSHSAMFVGRSPGTDGLQGRITCHTFSRFPGSTPSFFSDAWHLHPPNDRYAYTFIHFSDDDPPRAPLLQRSKDLPGWWQLDGVPPVFQYIDPNGTSYFTTTRPSPRTAKPPEAEKAWWFVRDPNQVVFVWRKSGTVDVWTAAARGRSGFEVVTNLRLRRGASKLA